MNKAKEKALKKYPVRSVLIVPARGGGYYADSHLREGFIEGYQQAEKDIKEELSKLFREFMMDCANDNTDTHILHFVEVFNDKIKEIGNE